MPRSSIELTAVAVGSALVLGGALWTAAVVTERREQAADDARWDAQTALLTAAVERVRLPRDYQPIECTPAAEGSAARCWRTPMSPEEVRPDLADALAAAGLTPVASSCQRSPGGTAIGCMAQATPDDLDGEPSSSASSARPPSGRHRPGVMSSAQAPSFRSAPSSTESRVIR